jgi:tetratricopeptide (TPR) repeat protein
MEKLIRQATAGIVLILVAVTVWSQKGAEDGSKYGHGEDSLTCLRNLSLYREYVKYGDYKDGIVYWRMAFNDCPASSQNMYIDGIKMYNQFIVDEKDPVKQDALIDTLMLVYDQRIQFFGQKGSNLGRKAIDLLRYKNNDIIRVEEGYKYLEESVNMLKNKSPMPVIATFMTATYTLFQEQRLLADQVISNYSVASEIIDFSLVNDPDDSDALKVKDYVDKNFIASGAATCQSLIHFFKPQFETNKGNIPYLKRVVTFMVTLDCEQDPLYAQAAEALYELEPSAQSAFSLAKLFVTKDQFTKAAVYYQEAIEKETDPDKKADYYYQLGVITNSQLDDPQTAKKYALEALNYRPNWGEPYILIGDTYVACKNCFDDEFEKTTVYWAAVDKFIKAKNIDSTVTEKANERIQTYSLYFPDVETTFFYSLKEGDPYTVGCWINEKTTVRSR